MALKFEELKILQAAEKMADGIWKQVIHWDPFIRDTMGKQIARAADSIGANIAEAFGRYHYAEKIQFLYYARGSLFETKYWLNRVQERQLMTKDQAGDYALRLSELARQLNSFISDLKIQSRHKPANKKSIRDYSANYAADWDSDLPIPMFSEEDFHWLENT